MLVIKMLTALPTFLFLVWCAGGRHDEIALRFLRYAERWIF